MRILTPILLCCALVSLVVFFFYVCDTGPPLTSNGYAKLRSSFQHVLDEGLEGLTHSKWVPQLPSSSMLELDHESEELKLQELRRKICRQTAFQDTCEAELSNFPILRTAAPLETANFVLRSALGLIDSGHGVAIKLSGQQGASLLEEQCASDCAELLLGAEEYLHLVVTRLSEIDRHICNLSAIAESLVDAKVWLSTSLSYLDACNDNFDVARGSIAHQIVSSQARLHSLLAIGLGIVDAFSRFGCSIESWPAEEQHSRSIPAQSIVGFLKDMALAASGIELDLLGVDESDGFPRWISPSDRNFLQSSLPTITANAVVAKDGSGQYTTVTAAVNAIPSSYSGRYVIYIKSGLYDEVFNVTKKNITFVGDGIGKSVITGNRNVASGDYNTYRTSTVGISGSGFFAVNMTFRNTAGADGEQAVAVRAGADHLVFYQCSFEGYQDTLYALSSRQFYRDCQIYGTVDTIFGNAVAVFQNSALWARKPNKGQQNTYTAQGRTLSSDVSGYSFHYCSLMPDSTLTQATYTVETYFGRPWKEYSRTVFLQSEIQSLVQPEGWLPWNSSNPYTDTVYYGEYGNRGAGADTSQRVSWKGVHPDMSASEASQFTVSSFLGIQSWLDSLSVPYWAGLL
ncbi:hypothetical protein KP509_25G070900 [Ceratopteris richardii]|uniref:Pectinesterase inhibitor domain-containing protein n=1 Tax=Ceratopteris richardii TaxID=49495 RepID=A0A8T2RU81_CERRI|nr:hypothetical protein KP509_25G070900 [Ceratopteris richardii]